MSVRGDPRRGGGAVRTVEDGDGVLLTDMFGGTPSTSACRSSARTAEVLTG